MPGTKKNTRSTKTKKNVTTRSGVASSLVDAFTSQVNPKAYYAEIHLTFVAALNRFIERTGAIGDWNKLMFRMMTGAVAADEYFTPTVEIASTFNIATTALHIVKIRADVTEEWGVTDAEVKSIMAMLELTDTILRSITAKETLRVQQLTDGLITIHAENNAKFYPKPVPAVANMVTTLQQEFQAVRHQAVPELECTPLLAAA